METLLLIVGTLGMGLGTAYFAYLGTQSPEGGRYFYWITAAITGVAFVSYLAMATGAGSTILDDGREFYYFRYIDWLITTPLLLLDLALLALARPGRNTGLIAGIIGLDILMILTGLVAGSSTSAFVTTVFFIISTAALVGVLYLVYTRLFVAARTQSPNVARIFNTLALLTIVLWSLYPVVFLLGTEGFRALPQGGEIFLFLILDLLAKVGFGFLLLSNRQAIGEVGGGGQSARQSRVS
jgi:bacteriorhodopsin